MTIADRAVPVTGANRGIGRALVAEALRRGAKRVYAGTRQPLTHPDGRVTSLTLDVTNPAQIQAAAGRVDSLDQLPWPWGVTQALLPLLTRSRGAIVNNVSLMALAALPLTPASSIPKAAAASADSVARAITEGGGSV
jgi:NAD(P)-dependent dehydrogenase (short-subunit alcohol dehydrogenase family)